MSKKDYGNLLLSRSKTKDVVYRRNHHPRFVDLSIRVENHSILKLYRKILNFSRSNASRKEDK